MYEHSVNKRIVLYLDKAMYLDVPSSNFFDCYVFWRMSSTVVAIFGDFCTYGILLARLPDRARQRTKSQKCKKLLKSPSSATFSYQSQFRLIPGVCRTARGAVSSVRQPLIPPSVVILLYSSYSMHENSPKAVVAYMQWKREIERSIKVIRGPLSKLIWFFWNSNFDQLSSIKLVAGIQLHFILLA